MRSGQIDAISNLDPVITLLQRSGDLKIVSDTRIVAESEKVFGGPMPAGCLYAPQTFIDKNPTTAQALTNAHGARQQVDPGRRARRHHQDRARELPARRPRGLHRRLPGRQGRAVARRPDSRRKGADTAFRALASIDAEIAKAKLDLKAVYTNDFVKKANAKYPKG